MGAPEALNHTQPSPAVQATVAQQPQEQAAGRLHGREAIVLPAGGQPPEALQNPHRDPPMDPANLNGRASCCKDLGPIFLICAVGVAVAAACILGFMLAPLETLLIMAIALALFSCYLSEQSRIPHPEFAE